MVAVYIWENYYRRGLCRIEWFESREVAAKYVADHGFKRSWIT